MLIYCLTVMLYGRLAWHTMATTPVPSLWKHRYRNLPTGTNYQFDRARPDTTLPRCMYVPVSRCPRCDARAKALKSLSSKLTSKRRKLRNLPSDSNSVKKQDSFLGSPPPFFLTKCRKKYEEFSFREGRVDLTASYFLKFFEREKENVKKGKFNLPRL